MEGFILAAGLGTRLRPLTDDRPKALVEVGGETLLEAVIRRMENAGIMHIVVNVRKYKHTVQTPICRLTEPERAQDAAPSALLKAEKRQIIRKILVPQIQHISR